MEIRCENGIKFGNVENGILEVKCRSTRCGHRPGVVVIHYISLETGDLLKTKRFKDITSRKEAKSDRSPLRSS